MCDGDGMCVYPDATQYNGVFCLGRLGRDVVGDERLGQRLGLDVGYAMG